MKLKDLTSATLQIALLELIYDSQPFFDLEMLTTEVIHFRKYYQILEVSALLTVLFTVTAYSSS